MALSRLAKKFRDQEPTPTPTQVVSKKAEKLAKKKATAAKPAEPAAPVVVAPPPAPEPPPAPPEPPKPGKRQQEKIKRPKFVYVPSKTERKPTATTPAPLPPRSNKLSAKIMTQNLALPPEDEPGRVPGMPGFGRL